MRISRSPAGRYVLHAAAAGVLLALPACSNDAKAAKRVAATTTTTSTTSTTSTTTTTTTIPVPVAVAPLTGLGVDAAGAPRLFRPALAVKIDNSADAMPQSALNLADLVFEIKVEGISRLMVVLHSNDAEVLGPIRSARYSDPNILALLGQPLFGWSGANDGVVSEVLSSPWIHNVNWDRVKNSDYRRRSDRGAPHNLYTSSATLYGYATADQGVPPAQFEYLAPGASNTGALPIAGVKLSVGDTPSAWAWDSEAGWKRWQYNRRHNDETLGQVTAANVVILETTYSGGSKTPTAVTVGSGRVAVCTGGTIINGTWSRKSISDRLTLTGADGQPIRLTPGRTWVELTSGSTVQVLSTDAVAILNSSK